MDLDRRIELARDAHEARYVDGRRVQECEHATSQPSSPAHGFLAACSAAVFPAMVDDAAKLGWVVVDGDYFVSGLGAGFAQRDQLLRCAGVDAERGIELGFGGAAFERDREALDDLGGVRAD